MLHIQNDQDGPQVGTVCSALLVTGGEIIGHLHRVDKDQIWLKQVLSLRQLEDQMEVTDFMLSYQKDKPLAFNHIHVITLAQVTAQMAENYDAVLEEIQNKTGN